MTSVFIKILNMSIAAGWLILAVAAVRLALKKAPKGISCALWAVVAIRLLCPFFAQSAFSLIPSAQTVHPAILYGQTGITSGIPALNRAVNPATLVSAAPVRLWATGAAHLWLLGVAAMFIWAAVSYLRIYRRVREGVPLRGNVLLCDRIDTPFIFGIFRPRIYLPAAPDAAQIDYVIAHEKAHLKRHDHWWKPLGFALLAVYWFNPLCWLAYVLLCRDIELACDERVVRDYDAHGKKAYSEALLSCSVPRRMVAACPLAFGEVGVGQRVKSVLRFKKPAIWVIAAAVAVCGIVVLCFLTNPKPQPQPLTLADVVRLSQKGEALSWADFDDYSYIETGSGLYIRVYEIDERFSVWIGGGPTDQPPMYLRLVCEGNIDDYIDIRTQDAAAFIEAHTAGNLQNDSMLVLTDGQVACARVGYSEDGYSAMVDRAENRDTAPQYGNVELLMPVVKLDSRADFDEFYQAFSPYFDFSDGQGGLTAFETLAAQYDEAFFSENTLLLAYLAEESDAARCELEEARIEGGVLALRIRRIVPDGGGDAMTGWLLAVALPKSETAGCTDFDAYICATVYPDRQKPSGNLTHTYTYDGGDPLHTAAISLYDSGEFIFTPSPLSSYMGYGVYTAENDRMTLKTEDGSVYAFYIVEDTLIFDAAASSANPANTFFTDGAAFTE